MTIKISEEQAKEAIRIAKAMNNPFKGANACARIYVQFVEKFDAKSKVALQKAGLKPTPRPGHGNNSSIYVGYDNATGTEYVYGECLAAAFKTIGFRCYQDADMD